jgi:D-hydroxyproline dehydrogenase subunit gamma
MSETVTIFIDGDPVEVPNGISLGAVLHGRGPGFRRNVFGQPRGLYCGMGVCFECQVQINGRLKRACVEPVAEGLRVATDTLPI